MTRPWPCDVRTILSSRRALRLLGLDVHRLLPVHPVAVANEQGDGGARRHAVPYAREDLRAVALDLHPPAAAVSTLATPELEIERVDVELKTCGHAVNGHDQGLAVRLARGQKSQHPLVILYEGPRSVWRHTHVPESAASRVFAIGRNCALHDTWLRFIERFLSSSRLHRRRA